MSIRAKLSPVAAIIAFCHRAPSLVDADPATDDAYRALIAIANARRHKGRTCAHQNENYPWARCTRRAWHKGRHAMPSKGASW